MTTVKFKRGPLMPVEFRSVFNDLFKNMHDGPAFQTSILESAVNVVEKENATELHIALPGIDKNDVDIRLNKDTLEIEVTREEKHEEKRDNFQRVEFDFSQFKKSFYIPETIDTGKIDARFENGVLIVDLPKKQEVIVKPKKIAVK